MKIQIRPAQISDLEQIMHIYNREIETGTATWRYEALSLEEYLAWFNDMQEKKFPIYVAFDEEQNKVAGYADYGSFRAFAGYHLTVEHSVYIAPQYAHQGLGTKLMHVLMDHAKQQGIHVMIAAIDHSNQASIQIHQKLGFKQTAYMPQVGQKFGKWLDLVLMQFVID